MKKIIFFISVIASMLLCACSGGDTIHPASEKIQGPLGEFFQIVTEDYKVKDGKISIELKRLKAGLPAPWKKGMQLGYSDGMCELQLTVELLNAESNVLSNQELDLTEGKDTFDELVALGVGKTATITFDCEEGAKQFKMGSMFKYHGEVETTVTLDGGIGPYPLVMTMHIAPNGDVTGACYYKRMGPGHYLYLKGKKTGDSIHLDEFGKDGHQSGEYFGEYKNGVLKGNYDARPNEYEYVLNPSDMEPIDFSDIDFSRFVPESSDYEEDYGSSYDYDDDYGSTDWDELLDSYEEFVNRYISLLKKAQQGDMDALTEYPALLEKATEMEERLVGVQDQMSSAQVNRLLSIQRKLANALR